MPEDCKPDAAPALTNAERQANYRARRQALQATPTIRYRRPSDRRSRPQRWHDAVAELLALQAEYTAWSDALPEGLSEPRPPRRSKPSSNSTSATWPPSSRPEATDEIKP